MGVLLGGQSDLFESAQFSDSELNGIAQKKVRNSNLPLKLKELRKGRANRLHVISANCAQAHSSSLFAASEDALEELRVEHRQLVVALTELNSEATALNVELAPWYEAARDAAKWHNEDVEQRGFRLGGEQAATRRQWVVTLDRLRSGLAPVFKLAGEVRNAIRSAENRLRSVRAEIKIIEGKMKRKSTA